MCLRTQYQGDMKKNSLPGTVILLLFYLLTWSCGKNDADSTTAQAEKEGLIKVQITRPTIQRVEHIVKAVGSFLPNEEVSISPEIDGKVKRLLVDEGHAIKKGQMLAIIEDESFRLEVERRKAQVEEARASLENLRVTLHRKEQLLREEMISQQDYDDMVTKVRLGEAQLESAKATLNLAKKKLKDTRIYAPMDGIIIQRLVSVGEYVQAGNILFKMVSINPLKLFFTFPERYSSYLSVGKEVTLEVRAYPGEVFKGTIYFINPQIEPKTRAVQMKAYVKNDEMKLKPGFFADVDMVVDVNERAMVLPQEAVLYKGDRTIVYTIEDGIAHERQVEIGAQFDGKIEILWGINPDSIIATKGNYLLEDGRKVAVMEEATG